MIYDVDAHLEIIKSVYPYVIIKELINNDECYKIISTIKYDHQRFDSFTMSELEKEIKDKSKKYMFTYICRHDYHNLILYLFFKDEDDAIKYALLLG